MFVFDENWVKVFRILGLVSACSLIAIFYMDAQRVKSVESLEPAITLKKKYPREAGVITHLSAKALVVKGIQEGNWFYVMLGSRGKANCLKYFYGKDGLQMLRELRVDIERDTYMSPEECFEMYGIKPKFGI